MQARVLGQSIFGPGLDGWPAACRVLRGEVDWERRPTQIGVPEILSARERRRASSVVRLALCAATQASDSAQVEPSRTAAVFASALGDGAVVDNILRALASPEKLVSPTMFHNSVHNAAVGYWSIATASHQPATSIAAGDRSFAAGLLKALMQVGAENREVLLVQFDCPLPEPLMAARPLGDAFAVGMVLGPADAGSGPLLEATFGSNGPSESGLPEPLEPLLSVAPAGRALPLLRLIAQAQSGTVQLEVAAGFWLNLTVTA
jgi:hypothetical protein